MQFDHSHYVPCLRWKQGEYQAVLRLSDWAQDGLTPLIEAPAVGWDFEKERQTRTLDDHLVLFVKRIRAKWERRPCFVDLCRVGSEKRMASGAHPIRFVFDELRKLDCQATPVTYVDKDGASQQEMKTVSGMLGSGVCLRIRVEQAAKKSLTRDVDALLSTLGHDPERCDLILDLGAPPNFLPLKGLSKAIQGIVRTLPHLDSWRTFTFIGTSFPETMGGVKVGAEVVPRHEWQLYGILINSLRDDNLRLPAFGDYTIAHPGEHDADMRLVKPSAKIRYAITDNWYIVKGKNVREEKFGKFEQYRGLCRNVVESAYYCGPTYSWADAFIKSCADGTGKTGNLTTWVQVDINHHIEKVCRDIASFYAASNTA